MINITTELLVYHLFLFFSLNDIPMNLFHQCVTLNCKVALKNPAMNCKVFMWHWKLSSCSVFQEWYWSKQLAEPYLLCSVWCRASVQCACLCRWAVRVGWCSPVATLSSLAPSVRELQSTSLLSLHTWDSIQEAGPSCAISVITRPIVVMI